MTFAPLFAVLALSAPEAPAVRLAVVPAAAADPALKHRLLPAVRDLAPGNPVQWYVRCFAEQRNFFYSQDAVEMRARLRAAPLAELAKDDLRAYGGNALAQADYAARLDAPDWGVLRRVQDDGLALRLPELDGFRRLGEGLHLRLRGQVARDDVPAAVRTLQTMLAFARHLGDHPAADANRLGLATANLALDGLEELLARPGCPNLVWPLTDLPTPLVDIRKGAQGDRARAAAELRGLKSDEPMTAAEVDALVGRLSGRLGLLREAAGLPPRGLRSPLADLARDAGRVAAARKRLTADRGWRAGDILMPPEQVVLLDERRLFEARCDAAERLLNLPLPDADRLAAVLPGGGLLADLAPDPLADRREQVRLDQRVAVLRHVEAARLAAAAHAGAVPAHPAGWGVPLPPDPATGKPLRVTVAGDTVTLHAGPTRPGGPGRRYEVTVREAQKRGSR